MNSSEVVFERSIFDEVAEGLNEMKEARMEENNNKLVQFRTVPGEVEYVFAGLYMGEEEEEQMYSKKKGPSRLQYRTRRSGEGGLGMTQLGNGWTDWEDVPTV